MTGNIKNFSMKRAISIAYSRFLKTFHFPGIEIGQSQIARTTLNNNATVRCLENEVFVRVPA